MHTHAEHGHDGVLTVTYRSSRSSGLPPRSWTPIRPNGGVQMAKYSEQFKLTVVKAYLEGNIGFR
ncbi:hypothetical protein, partial [Pseudomonas syringae]|uniref:hypothetical protein n=1 Tax=Pseudomonas syringae TaxID=317 RepID=UPI001CA53D6B